MDHMHLPTKVSQIAQVSHSAQIGRKSWPVMASDLKLFVISPENHKLPTNLLLSDVETSLMNTKLGVLSFS